MSKLPLKILVRGEKKQGHKYRAQSWLGLRGLTGNTGFVFKGSIYRDTKVI